MSDNVIFEEKFEGSFADDWTWLREVPEWSKVGDGVLCLRSMPGTLWGDNDSRPQFPAASPAASARRAGF